MKRSSWLLVAALASGCGMSLSVKEMKAAQGLNLGEESSVDFRSGYNSTVALFDIAGDGEVTVTAEPVIASAKIEIDIFPFVRDAQPVATGGSPQSIKKLAKGKYYVRVRNEATSTWALATPTRVNYTVSFKPADPDAQSGDDKDPSGARDLAFGKKATGTLSYPEMNRTDHWMGKLDGGGTLNFKLIVEPAKAKVTAEVMTPAGDALKLDARKGLEIKDAKAGEYIVKIQAEEGQRAKYTLTATAESADPDADSGEDGSADGATELQFKPKPGGNTQTASAKDSVDFDKHDATDWYRVSMPDKGKLSIMLKLKNPRAKVRAEFMRSEADDGRRVTSGFNVDVDKSNYFIKVFAADQGESAQYTLEVEYYPANYIDARVVEIDRKGGCSVMVDRGSSHQVRQSARANILVGTQTVATGFVDQVFPAISKVKVSAADCKFGQDAKVQIEGF